MKILNSSLAIEKNQFSCIDFVALLFEIKLKEKKKATCFQSSVQSQSFPLSSNKFLHVSQSVFFKFNIKTIFFLNFQFK